MVICKYFQKGICTFGDNCRYQHLQNDDVGGRQYGYQSRSQYGYQGRSDYRYNQGSSRYSYNDNSSDYNSTYRSSGHSDWMSDNRGVRNHAGSYDHNGDSYTRGGGVQHDSHFRKDQDRKDNDNQELTNAEILEAISEDMEQWELGKMWLFSCYGYAREARSLPGLEDLSVEEVRLAAYEANSSGKSAAYIDWISQLEKEYKAKRSELRKPDALAKSSLIDTIKQIKSFSMHNITSTTAFAGGVNDFTGGSSSFGGGSATSAANTFKGGTNHPQTDAFPSNGFGTFNSHLKTISGAESLASNFFAGSENFGTTPQNFPFTVSTPVSANSMPTEQNVFGSGSFLQQNLSGTPTVTSLGGCTVTQYSAVSQNSSIQQKPMPQLAVAFERPQELLFTPLVQLTTEEKAEFENVTFNLGLVPLRPPPKERI